MQHRLILGKDTMHPAESLELLILHPITGHNGTIPHLYIIGHGLAFRYYSWVAKRIEALSIRIGFTPIDAILILPQGKHSFRCLVVMPLLAVDA